MGTKKLVAGVTLAALLGSDLGGGVVAALGQTTGNGSMPVPSLTDGALGSVPPGTPAPYQQQLQLQPQPIPQRQLPPAPANLCQPGPARSYQTVSVPLALDAARQQIAEAELDILFYCDLGMEPWSYFLAFARFAASAQDRCASSHGGLPNMRGPSRCHIPSAAPSSRAACRWSPACPACHAHRSICMPAALRRPDRRRPPAPSGCTRWPRRGRPR